MSEEEIERISGEIAPCDLLQDGELKRSEYRALRREGIEMGLRAANTRSKSLTEEKGRAFAESEVKAIVERIGRANVLPEALYSWSVHVAKEAGVSFNPA